MKIIGLAISLLLLTALAVQAQVCTVHCSSSGRQCIVSCQ
jgi:hypothetical protein